MQEEGVTVRPRAGWADVPPETLGTQRRSQDSPPPFQKRSFPGKLLFILQYPVQMPLADPYQGPRPSRKRKLCPGDPQALPHSLGPSPQQSQSPRSTHCMRMKE